MDNHKSLYTRVKEAVSSHRYSRAFDLLHTLAVEARLPWETTAAIDTLRTNYTMLRNYAVEGIDDSGRQSYSRHIGSEILRIADIAMRACRQADAPGIYYSTLRVALMNPDDTIESLIRRYRTLYAKISFAQMGNAPAADRLTMRRELDMLADRIFNLVWVTHPLTSAQCDVILEAVAHDGLPSVVKEMILSAAMLGNIEYFDETRLTILARAYITASGSVEMRALTCLMIALWMSRERVAQSPSVASLLAGVSEAKSTWPDDLKAACLALARTRDTQRVSQTLRDEIIPEMMKMRPEIMKDITSDSLPDISSMSADEAADMLEEFNPEWEEVFEKSGLGEKLRALTDMQAEGADVMMGTFANLKGYPFFRDVAAWFTPYDPAHSAVVDATASGLSSLADIVAAAPGLCDSDKYSFILSLSQVPEQQKAAIARQFRIHETQMAEMAASELHPELYDRYRMLDSDIHDAYRFFNVFRRKDEFDNPFAGSGVTLAAASMLLPYVKDADALEPMSDFYFRKGYYAEALSLFTLIDNEADKGTMPRTDLYQKIGFCHQAAGNYRLALDYYRKSELITPDSTWTIRRIALCSRKLGLNAQALEYYNRLAAKEPHSVSVALSVGHCLLALDKPQDALASYYKAQFLANSDEPRYIRPIAWCSFLTGDYDVAREYYAKLGRDAEVTDLLNTGHVAMARKAYKEAVDCYHRVQQSGADLEMMVESDLGVLLAAGVDPLMLDLIVDAAL